MPITRREGLTMAAAAAIATGPAARAAPPALDVVVIGAGVFGAWSAAMLKRAGAQVALVDAYGAANARASSAGESRVTRLSYGGDPLYSEMARESLAEWSALSDSAATPLLYRTGVLWFSPAGDAYMAKSLAYLERTNTPHLRFDAAAMRARYPQMRFKDGEAGFLERDTGALIAGRAVQTLVARDRIPPIIGAASAPSKSDGVFEPVAGVRAKSLVYALGPWLPKLFPALLAGRIVATRQEVVHFGTGAGDARFEPGSQPVWADFNDGDIVYGFPALEGQGFKIAFDAHGEEVDPDMQDRRVSARTIERARTYLAERFPDLAAAPVVHSRVCQYENSSNGDFLIDRHPGFENVWLVGAGSGHGFKHGPAVGARVAAHVLGTAKAIEPRFALASKATVSKRTVF